MDEKKSEEIVKFIMGKLKDEPDTLQQLLVLGNTGSFSVFPFLKSCMTDPKLPEQVRAAAISVTRLINQEEVSDLLSQLLLYKETVLVKAAKETIAFRERYFETQ